MTLSEYQNAAFRTCPDLGKPYYDFLDPEVSLNLALKLNLNHMVSGMNSELSELNDATDNINAEEEFADIMWYVAGYCTWKRYELENIVASQKVMTKNLAWHIQELTDLVKKFTAYNKPIDSIKECIHIGNIVAYIMNFLKAERFNAAIQNNIDKLKTRYPQAYNDHDAINRNLENERKELEK